MNPVCALASAHALCLAPIPPAGTCATVSYRQRLTCSKAPHNSQISELVDL